MLIDISLGDNLYHDSKHSQVVADSSSKSINSNQPERILSTSSQIQFLPHNEF
jgi:hypothetical protein